MLNVSMEPGYNIWQMSSCLHMASTEEEACLDITDRKMEGKRHNIHCAMVFNTYSHNSCQAEYKRTSVTDLRERLKNKEVQEMHVYA